MNSLATLAPRYDLVVIGGGISGAGVACEAVRDGASVLLVEQNDFASGTSSASSKLVHGGLRYLKQGQWRLTLESVRERQSLLREAPDLVERLNFCMPIYRGARPGRATMRLGLWLYDRMAGKSATRWITREALLKLQPEIRSENLLGAVAYDDAQTDDARLVLSVLAAAERQGATLRNYTQASLRRQQGGVVGVALRSRDGGEHRDIEAGIVINATGAWADQVDTASGVPLRPLRGSHFVFPAHRLPLQQAVSWLHPLDRRPVFAYPWLGATLYGTTDLDHGSQALDAPHMSAEESAYLIEGLRWQFPRAGLTAADALSVYAGVRPVVAGGKGAPSAESRESALWASAGLVSIAGGKLTTFRVAARAALTEAAKQLPKLQPGIRRPLFASHAPASGFSPIGDTPWTWDGLRRSAREEWVQHLDDLLLRRTRIGLVTPNGGAEYLPRIREIACAALGWDDARWQAEQSRYLELWQQRHAPPA